MREILFKAKRIDNGEWVEGFYCKRKTGHYDNIGFHDEYKDCIIAEFSDGGITWCDVDQSTLCACTGLKDKHGQKIWENDIVDFFGHKGKIKYECGSFGIAYKDYIDWEEIEANICHITGCDNALYACENDNFISLWEIYWNFNDEDNSVNTVEVIGDIFDNPELLSE